MFQVQSRLARRPSEVEEPPRPRLLRVRPPPQKDEVVRPPLVVPPVPVPLQEPVSPLPPETVVRGTPRRPPPVLQVEEPVKEVLQHPEQVPRVQPWLPLEVL